MNFFKKTKIRIKTFFKYRELFFQLVSRDIRLKYRRSFLGYIWSVLNPLLTMIVMVLVFSNIFRFTIENFPVYLLIGQMLFTFMNSSVSRSLGSVIENAGLLKKIYIPKYIFTLASVTSELITFIFMMGALLIVIFFTKTIITWRFIFILIPVIQIYIFSIGLSLFLAQATVFFRDVTHIWGVVSVAWLYLSCIFYPAEILPDWLYKAVSGYNPMYFYITMFRNFTFGTVGVGNLNLAIRGAIAAIGMLSIGCVSFTLSKNKFILYI